MKHLLQLLLFILPLASFSQVLVRDVFDFAVGDTLLYRKHEPPSAYEYGYIITGRTEQSNHLIYQAIKTSSGDVEEIVVEDIDSSIYWYFRNKSLIQNDTQILNESDLTTDSLQFCLGSYVLESIYNGPCANTDITTNNYYKAAVGFGIVTHDLSWYGDCIGSHIRKTVLLYAHKTDGTIYRTDVYPNSINEGDKAPQAKVFYNAYADAIYITLPYSERALFTVYNMEGRLIFTKELQGMQSSISGDLPTNGVYFWQLIADGKTAQTGKLIKY